jgi:hypothetical protein
MTFITDSRLVPHRAVRSFDPASPTCYWLLVLRADRRNFGLGRSMPGWKNLNWIADWAWGLPLLIVTVVLHVSVFLLLVRTLVNKTRSGTGKHSHGYFIVALALIALGAAALHSFEASLWALLYMRLGALPDGITAMLYSLGAITSYGHAGVFLEDRWKLLGAIEAMNGLILFGLTTAFLFSAIEEIRPTRRG